jgi:solute carrier family 25 (adenine nucleotide translocator) protein 4/5/6/31
MKEWDVNREGKTHKDLSFVHAFLIGQISAFVASMLSYPLDTVRRRLTIDAGKSRHLYSGTIDCTKVGPSFSLLI